MFWTVMPLDIVMDGSDTFEPSYSEIPWKNGTLLVEEQSRNLVRIVRVISSNPGDYLDPTIQPGKIIEYSSINQTV